VEGGRKRRVQYESDLEHLADGTTLPELKIFRQRHLRARTSIGNRSQSEARRDCLRAAGTASLRVDPKTCNLKPPSSSTSAAVPTRSPPSKYQRPGAPGSSGCSRIGSIFPNSSSRDLAPWRSPSPTGCGRYRGRPEGADSHPPELRRPLREKGTSSPAGAWESFALAPAQSR